MKMVITHENEWDAAKVAIERVEEIDLDDDEKHAP